MLKTTNILRADFDKEYGPSDLENLKAFDEKAKQIMMKTKKLIE